MLAAGPKVPCSCRYQGQSYQLGSTVCLKTPQGERMARCEMVLNNTSWHFLEKGCPLAVTPGRARAGHYVLNWAPLARPGGRGGRKPAAATRDAPANRRADPAGQDNG
ncbi:hypothetical protein [Rhodobium gokarnense]|uniref:Uncharacterized protein n=1 Tax=Rhodobium gokarnense TaxID=364296 RepID=A0ABT3HFL7_9HYPH|nr:hypothetical protein [Rhodobium gokarnense]MCW2309197.1 hypothetical protein [Rhodobium gokarnense]